MLKARPDRKNPSSSSGAKPAGMIGSRSVDRIRAAVICAANAVHMTAPAEDHHAQKTLATGEPSTHDDCSQSETYAGTARVRNASEPQRSIVQGKARTQSW